MGARLRLYGTYCEVVTGQSLAWYADVGGTGGGGILTSA